MPIISDSTFMLTPMCNPIRISISFALMAGPLLLVPQKSSLGRLQWDLFECNLRPDR